jgi:hypothetical protein
MRVLVCIRKLAVQAVQGHQALFQVPLLLMRAAVVLVDMLMLAAV